LTIALIGPLHGRNNREHPQRPNNILLGYENASEKKAGEPEANHLEQAQKRVTEGHRKELCRAVKKKTAATSALC